MFLYVDNRLMKRDIFEMNEGFDLLYNQGVESIDRNKYPNISNCVIHKRQAVNVRELKKVEINKNLKYNTYIKYDNSYMLIYKNYILINGKQYISKQNEEQRLADLCAATLDY